MYTHSYIHVHTTQQKNNSNPIRSRRNSHRWSFCSSCRGRSGWRLVGWGPQSRLSTGSPHTWGGKRHRVPIFELGKLIKPILWNCLNISVWDGTADSIVCTSLVLSIFDSLVWTLWHILCYPGLCTIAPISYIWGIIDMLTILHYSNLSHKVWSKFSERSFDTMYLP